MTNTPETQPVGTPHEFADMPFFETDVVLDIVEKLEEMDLSSHGTVVRTDFDTAMYQAWEGRTNLEDLLRPKDLHGSMQDLRVEELTDPYKMLLSATERGQTRANGSRLGARPASLEINETVLGTLTRGFRMHSDLTVRGMSGFAISSEVYYCPVPFSVKHRGKEVRYGQHLESYGGVCVARMVMQPEVCPTAQARHKSSVAASAGSAAFGVAGGRSGILRTTYSNKGKHY
jgi:hypothetical protein